MGGSIWGNGFLHGDDHRAGVDKAADDKAEQVVYDRFQWNVGNGIRLANQLQQQADRAQPFYVQLTGEIRDDTQPLVLAPGASTALPLLTARSVGLWNCAWSGIDVSGGAAAGIDAPGSGCSAADAKGPSTFDVRDALYSNALDAKVCRAYIDDYHTLRQWELDRAAHAKQ